MIEKLDNTICLANSIELADKIGAKIFVYFN
jgi:hypothetical protein